MNSGHSSRSQFFTLLNRMFDTDVKLSLWVVLNHFQPTGKVIGKNSTTHRSDPFDSGKVGNRHDAGNNWDVYSELITAVAKRKKIVVHKKQLRENSIRASIHFSF